MRDLLIRPQKWQMADILLFMLFKSSLSNLKLSTENDVLSTTKSKRDRNETFYDHGSLNASSPLLRTKPCWEQHLLCGSALAFFSCTRSICGRRCIEPFRGRYRGSDARAVGRESPCTRSRGVDKGLLSCRPRVRSSDASISLSCLSSCLHTSGMRRASR